jgi:hypothetical protein
VYLDESRATRLEGARSGPCSGVRHLLRDVGADAEQSERRRHDQRIAPSIRSVVLPGDDGAPELLPLLGLLHAREVHRGTRSRQVLGASERRLRSTEVQQHDGDREHDADEERNEEPAVDDRRGRPLHLRSIGRPPLPLEVAPSATADGVVFPVRLALMGQDRMGSRTRPTLTRHWV